MGFSSPIYGRVYAEMLLASPIRLSQFIQPRIEPELVVLVSSPLEERLK
jgi:2-oxo-3-hexenedioate decarboxylase